MMCIIIETFCIMMCNWSWTLIDSLFYPVFVSPTSRPYELTGSCRKTPVILTSSFVRACRGGAAQPESSHVPIR